jgi:hypothetical protein
MSGRYPVAATPVVVEPGRPPPFTVAVQPASGATMTVDFQLFDTGPWYAWDAGAVTAATIRTVRSAVRRVRFTRSVAGTGSSFGELL